MSLSHDVLPNESNFLTNINAYNIYLGKLKKFQCKDEPDLYKTFDAIPKNALLDYNTKMQFMELLMALSALVNTITYLSSEWFYQEKCEVIFTAIKLADDLAKPKVINQQQKISALTETIKAINAMVRADFADREAHAVIQATQNMEKVFLPSSTEPVAETSPSSFQFNEAVSAMMVGLICFMAGLVLFTLAPTLSSSLAFDGVILQSIGALLILFSAPDDREPVPRQETAPSVPVSATINHTRDTLKKFSIFTQPMPEVLRVVDEESKLSDEQRTSVMPAYAI